MEKLETLREAPSFSTLMRLVEGGGAGTGGEGDEQRLADALEEPARREAAEPHAGQIDKQDLEQARHIHDDDELDERQQHRKPVRGHGEGHQGENADGRVEHDDGGHADHDLAHAVEEVRDHPDPLAADAQGKSEQHGKEDDLEHAALGKAVHGIDGHDVEEHLGEAWRGDVPGLEVGRGQIKAHARLEKIGEHQADADGDGRGGEVVDQGLAGHAAKTAHIAHAGGAGDQGGKDQRHHHHAHEVDEELTERLEPLGVKAHMRRERPGKDAQHHADALPPG